MSDVIVKVKGLTKRFRRLTAVNKISFEVMKGEIFGFLGPNGAGKSTTINMLTTIMEPTKGTAVIDGHDLIKKSKKVRELIGVLPQEVALERSLTGIENLRFHAKLYHLDKELVEDKIKEVLELVGLYNKKDVLVKNYSGGMKRRLEVAKTFLHNPTLVFMDEPTLGLDPQTRWRIWDYIKKLNKEKGVTIFLTTHYLQEADYLCNRLAIIDYGKIIAVGSPQTLKSKLGRKRYVTLTVEDDFKKFISLLNKHGFKSEQVGKNIRVDIAKPELVSRILDLAKKHGFKTNEVSMKEPSLDDVFFHYTGRQIREV